MNLSKILLFLSGVFFGGALDHAFLAWRRSSVTPYGLPAGVRTNWAFALLDTAAAAAFYTLHHRLPAKNPGVSTGAQSGEGNAL